MEFRDIDFAGMPQKAIQVVTKPVDFFKGMPRTGGFLEPLMFALVMGLVSGVLQALMNVLGFGYLRGPMAGFGLILVVPIMVGLFSFVFAAILFAVWKIMGSSQNYEVSYRSIAYLTALSPITTLLGFIPYAGVMLNAGILTVYLVFASVHVHHIESRKAWTVFAIIGVVFALIGLAGERDGRSRMTYGEHRWMMDDNAARDLRESARDLEKAAQEMREQAERMKRELEEQRR